MSPGMRRTAEAVALATLIGGCAQPPSAVLDRPELPTCDGGATVFIPPRQGPESAETSSMDAIECFRSAVSDGAEAELAFILVGIEGDQFDAVLQTQNGSVSYFRESEFVGNWIMHENCDGFVFDNESQIPEVTGCR